jgi:hypothetical protein
VHETTMCRKVVSGLVANVNLTVLLSMAPPIFPPTADRNQTPPPSHSATPVPRNHDLFPNVFSCAVNAVLQDSACHYEISVSDCSIHLLGSDRAVRALRRCP